MNDVRNSLDLTALELAATALWMLVLCTSGFLVFAALGERRAVVAAPAGATLGLLAWVFLTNAFGFVLDIGTASIVATAVVIVAGLVGLRTCRRSGVVLGVGRKAAATLLILSVAFGLVSALISARTLMYDDREPSHISAALSMVYTAYPPLEPEHPTDPFNYHYAPETISASLLDVAGLPVWRGYDVQIALFATLAFATGFATIFMIAVRMAARRPFAVSLVGAAMVTMGAGWRWTAWFRDADVGLPGRGFTTDAFVNNMHTKSAAIGLPALLLTLILTLLLVEPVRSRARHVGLAVALLVTLAAFALSAETYLAVAVPMFVVLVVLESLRQRSVTPLLWTVPPAVGALLVSSIQGGVLSARSDVTTSESAFELSPEPFHVPTFMLGWLPMWSTEFLLEWLPLVVLALPAFWILGVRRREPVVIGAMAMGLVALAIPLVLVYPHHPPEIVRFLPIATLVLAVLAGITLVHPWVVDRSARGGGVPARIASLVVLASLLATSANFQFDAVLRPEEYLTGATPTTPRLAFEQGAPGLTRDEEEDIAALRKLPKGALVASPHSSNVTRYSGRLPALSLRDEDVIERIDRILRTGSTAGVKSWYPVQYVYCNTGLSEPCKELHDRIDRSDPDVLYYRRRSTGTAFIVKARTD